MEKRPQRRPTKAEAAAYLEANPGYVPKRRPTDRPVKPPTTKVKRAIEALANPSLGHARLGPSGAKKWMACPGSVVLEAAFPNMSSKYADEGTACHDVAARCLTGNLRASSFVGEYVAVNNEAEARRTVLFDEDMAELTQQYVDGVVELLTPTTKLWVETRVEISPWLDTPGQFGTADVATLDEYRGPGAVPGLDVELSIHDAKFGRTPVSIDTPQLPLYALGFLNALMSGKAPPTVVRPDRKRRAVVDTSSEESSDDLY